MPRRERPGETQRSEHWLRIAVNEQTAKLNALISRVFNWNTRDEIEWLSPIKSDECAEYFDQDFLGRLGVPALKIPLSDFWPPSGPRWDGLARTSSGKLILVEAKAYIEEAVDYRSRAANPHSKEKIKLALNDAKKAFRASDDALWDSPFYQHANRLAHLYFMRHLNGLDAYLLFLYFADAPDVPNPSTTEQWQGAARLLDKCLGLTANHPFKPYIGTLIGSVPEMNA